MSKISDIYGSGSGHYMTGGWYLMKRGWMEHGILQIAMNEIYSRREAWIWLIENAAWEDNAVLYKGQRIEIKRGEAPITIRDLMKKWGWSQGRVTRFINELQKESMVSKRADTWFCIITICNYDKFQNPLGKFGTDADTDADTDTDTDTDTYIKKKNLKNLKKENNTPPTPASGGENVLPINLPKAQKPDRFDEFWSVCLKKAKKPQARKAYTKAKQLVSEDILIDRMRKYSDSRRAIEGPEGLQYTMHPTTWLNNESWNDQIIEEQEEDEKAPKGMTPAEHAKWCVARLGICRIQ